MTNALKVQTLGAFVVLRLIRIGLTQQPIPTCAIVIVKVNSFFKKRNGVELENSFYCRS